MYYREMRIVHQCFCEGIILFFIILGMGMGGGWGVLGNIRGQLEELMLDKEEKYEKTMKKKVQNSTFFQATKTLVLIATSEYSLLYSWKASTQLVYLI